MFLNRGLQSNSMTLSPAKSARTPLVFGPVSEIITGSKPRAVNPFARDASCLSAPPVCIPGVRKIILVLRMVYNPKIVVLYWLITVSISNSAGNDDAAILGLQAGIS